MRMLMICIRGMGVLVLQQFMAVCVAVRQLRRATVALMGMHMVWVRVAVAVCMLNGNMDMKMVMPFGQHQCPAESHQWEGQPVKHLRLVMQQNE